MTFVMVYDVRAELAEINAAGRAFLIASALTLLVIAATGTIVATRLLRPLRQIRETAERITGQSLGERLPVVGNDDVADLSETMNDMLDRLDDALDSQRTLLSDVGHELKTPITIVRGHLEVMDPADADDARETQLLAIDELDRMDRLVQDLAAAAALHGPTPVQRLPIDAADLLEQITRKAEGIVGSEVVRGATAHVVASLDASRITQAMLQLAQNAVTHGGGRLEIGSDVDGESLLLWVRDFGPGVPDADKALVFERFHRGTTADGPTGSGLGLNIAQVIARAHGGRISVEDAPGGGARFVIRVPRGVTALPADVVIPPRPPLPRCRRPRKARRSESCRRSSSPMTSRASPDSSRKGCAPPGSPRVSPRPVRMHSLLPRRMSSIS
ncbi:sensor histidine kinase [Microbacterium sp. NIBRBAC000506063]|uniref:HAMP domain-containing sensor histidine kinase n=1 Tax=Microbacterium sp. NIBRBAC000506063 TaxID=2734618 RepID=UPI001BB5031C|nr:HAMP domain-containing sensor histidine kinase [Microbacterium sp. NIBRBAC000506063]QTV79673.1 HAMP domain-containing histidine kinase [Microbacterium sp. NIBRBAC000506063]